MWMSCTCIQRTFSRIHYPCTSLRNHPQCFLTASFKTMFDWIIQCSLISYHHIKYRRREKFLGASVHYCTGWAPSLFPFLLLYLFLYLVISFYIPPSRPSNTRTPSRHDTGHGGGDDGCFFTRVRLLLITSSQIVYELFSCSGNDIFNILGIISCGSCVGVCVCVGGGGGGGDEVGYSTISAFITRDVTLPFFITE